MGTVFLEILLQDSDLVAAGFEGRDEIEDPLAEALEKADLGEVTGAGGGMGLHNVDVEIAEDQQFDQALRLIRRTLRKLNVPASTRIVRHQPEKVVYAVYD